MNIEPIFSDIAEMDEAFGRVRIRQVFPVRDTQHFMDLHPDSGADQQQGNNDEQHP